MADPDPSRFASNHNRLVEEFTRNLMAATIENGDGFAGVMAVLESVLVAAMLANAKVFGLHDRAAAGLVDAAAHRATERFLAIRAQEREG